LNRVLLFVSIAGALALAIPAVSARQMNPWISLSILLFLLSYWLFRSVIGGYAGIAAKALILGLLLFDLSVFDWTARNKNEFARQGGIDQLNKLMSFRDGATFLKSRPGPFRVELDAEPKPNLGHVFGIPNINGTGVTALKDTYALTSLGYSSLFNTRYIVRLASAGQPGPVYQDSNWKVYEKAGAYPAAWIVHEAIIEPSTDRFIALLQNKEVDLYRSAALAAPLDQPLEPLAEPVSETVSFSRYEPNRLELMVNAQKRGLLILSEVDYPGWYATVNGREARIHRANGTFRAIEVNPGLNRVVMRYAPRSILFGGLLTGLAFIGTLLAFAWDYWHRRRQPS
jgi:hypothetical protein